MQNKTEDDILNEYTKRRISELQKHLTLKEIESESVLLKKSKTETLLVHFYNKHFPRCKEMNAVLEEIAPRFPMVQFLCAEAEQFPFITDKLQVKELPYLASFTKGYFVGGIIGFQDIGETVLDKKLLEQYILQSDLLESTTDKK